MQILDGCHWAGPLQLEGLLAVFYPNALRRMRMVLRGSGYLPLSLPLLLTAMLMGCQIFSLRHRFDPPYLAAQINSDKRTGEVLRTFATSGPKWVRPKSVSVQGSVMLVMNGDGRLWEQAHDNWRLSDTTGLPSHRSHIGATSLHRFVTAADGIYERVRDSNTWTRTPEVKDRNCSHILADSTDAFAFCEEAVWRYADSIGRWTRFITAPDLPIFGLLTDSSVAFAIISYPTSNEYPAETLVSYSRRDGKRQSKLVGTLRQLSWPLSEVEVPNKYAFKGLSEEIRKDLIAELQQDGNEIVATSEGLYRRSPGQETFTIVKGELDDLPVLEVLSANTRLFARTESSLFESANMGQSWDRMDVRVPALPAPIIVAGLPDRIVVGVKELVSASDGETRTGFIRRSRDAGSWEEDASLTAPEPILEVCGLRDSLFGISQNYVYVSNSQMGTRFQRASPEGFFGDVDNPLTHIACVGEYVFISRNRGVLFRRNPAGVWETLPKALDGSGVLRFHVAGDHLYAMNDMRYIFELATPSDKVWRKMTMNGVDWSVGPKFPDFWVDPTSRIVVLTGRNELLWSNDGGNSFSGVSSRDRSGVRSLAFDGTYLWGGSGNGVYYIKDQIPRPNPFISSAFDVLKSHVSEAVSIALVALLLIFGSSRLVLLCLQWDVPLVKDFAAWFYLTRYGRWRLYRKYRRNLLDRPSMRDLENHFVDLPCEWNDLSESPPFVERLTSLREKCNVVLVGPGGGGKSTACNRLVRSAAERIPICGKRRQPVLVEAYTYRGDFLDSVVAALKRGGAYVNRSIVESQCLMGHLLIVLDGYSEIVTDSIPTEKDLISIVSDSHESVFVISSRAELPPAISSAAHPLLVAKLPPLTPAYQKQILAHYLGEGIDESAVLEQIDLRYPNLAHLPLLLRLAAYYYGRHRSVPNNEVELFGEYLRDILAPEKINMRDAAGVHFAIEQLVKGMHIDRRGERGFLIDDAVSVLAEIGDQLKKRYGISEDANSLVQLLVHAGLLRTDGVFCHFFHDSFESYFAARVLEKEFLRGNLQLLRMVAAEPRLKETVAFLRKLTKPERLGALDAALNRESGYAKLFEAGRSPVKAAVEPSKVSEWPVGKVLQLDDKSPVYAYAFSPDLRRALTGSRDTAVRLWDLKTGRCLRLFEGHTQPVESVAWSADQRRALSAADDHDVRLWDIETGRCLRVLEGHTRGVDSVSWSPDQHYACSGSVDHSLRLWDLETGFCVGVLEGHTGDVASVEWSLDQSRVLSGSVDGSVRLWDVETRRCLRVLEGHDSPVYCAVWSPDQFRVLSSSDDGSVQLWDLETGQCLRVLEGHTDYVVAVAWAANGRHALSGSEDQSVRLWDVETRQCLQIFEGHTADVRGVMWAADQHYAVSGDAKGVIRCWNLLEAIEKRRAP